MKLLKIAGVGLALLVAATGTHTSAEHKVTICHYPQGGKQPALILSIGSAAVNHHLTNHTTPQDTLAVEGQCVEQEGA